MPRYLILANQTAASPELTSVIREIIAKDADTEFVLLVPATPVEDLLDWQGWQPFLSVYMSGRRDDPDFEVRLQAYLALFPVFWLGILLADAMRRTAAGELEIWMINEMEPNTRLRRYLARAQAWPAPDPNNGAFEAG